MTVCAFRHEKIPEQNTVELDAGKAAAKVCTRCLILIMVHRRIHQMKLEQLIPKMAE